MNIGYIIMIIIAFAALAFIYFICKDSHKKTPKSFTQEALKKERRGIRLTLLPGQ